MRTTESELASSPDRVLTVQSHCAVVLQMTMSFVNLANMLASLSVVVVVVV